MLEHTPRLLDHQFFSLNLQFHHLSWRYTLLLKTKYHIKELAYETLPSTGLDRRGELKYLFLLHWRLIQKSQKVELCLLPALYAGKSLYPIRRHRFKLSRILWFTYKVSWVEEKRPDFPDTFSGKGPQPQMISPKTSHGMSE